jgi:uncharacterized protein
MKLFFSIFFFIYLSAFSIYAEEPLVVPSLSNPVIDQANILNSAQKKEINQLLKNIYKNNGPQIAILTVNNLKGEPIENFSIRVVDKWKLGGLLLVSKEDQQLRIEVGQGLEGKLTDYKSHKIIKDVIIPHFKKGDFNSGVLYGLLEIIKVTDPDFKQKVVKGSSLTKKKNSTSWFQIIIYIIMIILFIRNPMDFLMIMLMFGGGRRSGGGLSGGGGFSGGGGGFSGGGASGSW